MSDKAIVTLAIGQKGQELHAKTGESLRAYADAQGYDLHVVTESPDPTVPASWVKLHAMRRLLDDYNTVVHVDADCLVVDSSDDMAAEVPDGYWQALCRAPLYPNEVNCGVWLVRRPAMYVLELLWLRRRERAFQHTWEQSALNRMLGPLNARPPKELLRHTYLLNPRWNTRPEHCDNPAILHASGRWRPQLDKWLAAGLGLKLPS